MRNPLAGVSSERRGMCYTYQSLKYFVGSVIGVIVTT